MGITSCIPLLKDLMSAHMRHAHRNRCAAQLRACILALCSLTPLEVTEAVATVMPDSEKLELAAVEAECRSVEERCEQRAAKRAIRAATLQMASLAAQWGLELALLKAEIAAQQSSGAALTQLDAGYPQVSAISS